MTQFTVVWDSDLEAEFIRFWTDAGSHLRALLTHASNWLDERLSQAPESLGQIVEGEPYRVIIVPGTQSPRVEVIYQVLPEDRLVRILSIRLRD
ncbi:MAG: hypothetical protein KY475_12275 [Planctomycetes bacterium]|nr:hypothetical protein [Planctomycetota bacterium]